jgi:DNA-binding response OmpR family regulator
MNPAGRSGSGTGARVIHLVDSHVRPINVLLVARDPTVAFAVRQALSDSDRPFSVEIATGLSSTLARLSRGGIDLILADLDLPDIRGAAAIQFLRRAAPRLPVIALSGRDELHVAVEAVRAGAEECVYKNPFTVRSLAWLIVLVMERHRRLMADLNDATVDPLTGLATSSALEVFGRYLIRLTDRTGMHLVVLYFRIQAAPQGRWSDWETLLVEVSGVLDRTLRRCDVLSRVGPMELAVVLVSDNGNVGGALPRIRKALAEVGAAPYVQMGLAVHRPGAQETLDELLEIARANADPVPV